MGAERERVAGFGRLDLGLRDASDWYLFGPYLSERQWGTVREDYSPDGDAWDYFPHDHARSRTYRWGEDGLAGFADLEQRLCLGLALWNGRDPILKDRLYGLTGPEGNHGEDAKEYWWYLDAVPSHAWNRWRYHYPQATFPYGDLARTSARRGRLDPEYELLDTGVFDGGYWAVEVDYAKADPTDLLMTVRVTNTGPAADTLHVLPTLWFRDTWSWDEGTTRPELAATGPDSVAVPHPFLGDLVWTVDGGPELLFCENETNRVRLWNAPASTPWPKDGINDHVVSGAATVNPDRRGTKCSAWYQLTLEPGATAEVHVRLSPVEGDRPDFATVTQARRTEADEFHAELTPPGASAAEAQVLRQAFAGMLWSKQFYAYDVARWLDGDPTQPPPPPSRREHRNAGWRGFDAYDLMSMPDCWEYPWFASWDLAFHCVALVHVDPAFAKYQLELLCREWFQHPNGQLPAYEWDFSDVNPPVQAWAALEVFALDGGTDLAFLSRVFDKLLINFTWWVNREDADGSNLFEGGFLGLDNIGPLDRSHLPLAGRLEQSDATGWMAMYALSMATIAAILHGTGTRPALDLVQTFLERFAAIRTALETSGCYDAEHGLFEDVITTRDGSVVPVAVRSMVGVIPMLAAAVVDEEALSRSVRVGKGFASYLDRREGRGVQEVLRGAPGQRRMLVGVSEVDQLRRTFATLFDPAEFLSPHGLRSLSAWHRDHPYELVVGGLRAGVDYEPAESTVTMFGGNSNWRGPVWFPLNYLVISALDRYGQFYGDEVRLEYPTGSRRQATLGEVADDLRDRLIGLFVPGPDGRRPCFGGVDALQEWGNPLFFEYFHGDNGAGLGASHQTGWTGLIADVIRRRHGAVPPAAELIERLVVGSPAPPRT